MQATWSSYHTYSEFEDKASVAKACKTLLQSFLIKEKPKIGTMKTNDKYHQPTLP